MAPGVPGPATSVVLVGSQVAFVGLYYLLSAPRKEPLCPACPPAAEVPPPLSPEEEGYSAPFLVFVASLAFLSGVGLLVLFGAFAAAVGAAGFGFAGGAAGGALTGAFAARFATEGPLPIEDESDFSGLVDDYKHELTARGAGASELQEW